MTKRQFFEKALLISLPIAATYGSAAEDPGWVTEKAGEIADTLTLYLETRMVMWDEEDRDPKNLSDPEYVLSTVNLSNGEPRINGN
jgi:hypothetical protein